ncbi:MAG: histidine phosphotransferase [Salinarimonas sp.]|nr:histidine phosphotransferase [Salinarimonas sp.]
MAKVDLDSLDLAALLCSRVCHDVISPVGAIVNGLEVMEDDSDPGMKDFALDLIRKSARQASARLQFARIAFGAAGSAGAAIDTGDAEQVAKGFFHDDKTRLAWNAQRQLLPKNRVKLLLNLLVMAAQGIPRGGDIDVTIEGDESASTFIIAATGKNARIPPHARALLDGEPEGDGVDAHGIQFYYAGLVARASNMTVSLDIEGEAFTLRAESA